MTLFHTGLVENKSNDIIALGTRMWMATDFNGIGRVLLNGNVTFFPINNNAHQPTSLAADSNNRLWYVEWNGSEVGRMTQSGLVSEFNAGFAGFSNSFGIAAGSDNRIWFCDPDSNRISRMTQAGGGLTHFTTGPGFLPSTIVAGPDGNLYFGTFDNKVGRITTAGVITEFAIPGASAGNPFPVLGMTVGPDGNIWFVNNASSQVGRLRLLVTAN